MGKGAQNAYGLFVKEQIAIFKRSGRNISIAAGYGDPEISQKWQEMSENDKEVYKQRARNNAGRPASSASTSESRPLSVLTEDWDDGNTSRASGLRRPESSINGLSTTGKPGDVIDFMEVICSELRSKEAVKNHKFIFMAANVMVRTGDGVCYPLEIGLVEFSLAKGMSRSTNIFVDCKKIPLGYAANAHDHQKTHRIPLKDFYEAEGNYFKILDEIREFIAPSEIRTGEYVLISDEPLIDTNRGSLEFLAERLDALPEEKIFYQKFVDSIKFMTTNQALSLMGKPVDLYQLKSDAYDKMHLSFYDYYHATNCEFHIKLGEDNMYCALGTARKWTYLLADALCKAYGVEISSQHIPPPLANIPAVEDLFSTMNNLSLNSSSAAGRSQTEWSTERATSRVSNYSRAVSNRSTTPSVGMGRGLRPTSRISND